MSFEALVQWVQKNGGVVSSKLGVNETNPENRFVYAKERIELNEELFYIPSKCCIQPIDRTVPDEIPLSFKRDYLFILELMKEMNQEKDSFYFPYLSYLPSYASYINFPVIYLYFHRNELPQVQKENLYFPLILQRIETLDQIMNYMMREPIVQEYCSKFQKPLQEGILYCYALIHSRSWNDHGLVPIADLFQHHADSQMFLESGCKMVTKKEYQVNQMIYDNYGVLDDTLMYLGFGFYDLMKQNFLVELSLPNYPSQVTQLDKIKSFWLSQLPYKKYVLSSKEIYPPIVYYLRIYHLSEKDCQRIQWNTETPFYESWISLENELEVIKQLIQLLSRSKNFNQSMIDEANRVLQVYSPSSIHYGLASLTLIHEKIFKFNIEVLVQNWFSLLQVPFDVKLGLSNLFSK